MTQALFFQVTMADPYETAVEKVTSALKTEGSVCSPRLT
jgi:hypothetical protein